MQLKFSMKGQKINFSQREIFISQRTGGGWLTLPRAALTPCALMGALLRLPNMLLGAGACAVGATQRRAPFPPPAAGVLGEGGVSTSTCVAGWDLLSS